MGVRIRDGRIVWGWQEALIVGGGFLAGTAFGFSCFTAATWASVRFLQWIGAL